MRDPSECTVLIVDDVIQNVDILVDALGSLYEISVAMDGQNALEVVRELPPDLILLDIMMPGMDGYELCHLLKQDDSTKDIPIIFLTALSEIDMKSRGFEAGAVDYITKPFEIPEVMARVHTHLSLKLARDAECEHRENLRQLNEQLRIQNQFIQKVFGRYLSDEIVRSILDTPEGLKLGGEKRTVTILMSDLRGFTSMSEKLPPENVVTMINSYLEIMTEIIMKYQGTIGLDHRFGHSIV